MVLDAAPTLVFNAAAFTAVDRAETEPDLARLVNEEAVGAIGDAAKKCGAAVVHYSTDYVFDGNLHRPYVEADIPNPLSVYGRTKLNGERALATSGAAHIVLRTGWVFAARGRNFVRTILQLARERDELRIVCDQIGSPTWARWLAVATVAVVTRAWRLPGGVEGAFADAGVLHLSGGGATSWHEFAEQVITEDPRRQEQRVQRIIPIATKDYPTAARRPPYAVLDGSKAARHFGIDQTDWRMHLRMMLDDAGPSLRSPSHHA